MIHPLRRISYCFYRHLTNRNSLFSIRLFEFWIFGSIILLPLDYSALASLETHAEEIRWSPDSGETPTRKYALFTRNGATRSVREAVSERDDVRLFSLDDVTHHDVQNE